MIKIFSMNYQVLIMVFCPMSLFNCSGQNIKNEIINSYHKIEKYYSLANNAKSQNDYSEKATSLEDSLISANKELIDYMKFQLSSSENSKLDYVQVNNETNIKVVLSSDKKLRVFSWDTHLGGTMNQYAVIFQFIDEENIKTYIVNSGDIYPSKNYTNIEVDSVRVIKMSDSNCLYLVVGNGKCDIMCQSKSVIAYSKDTDGLIENDRSLVGQNGNRTGHVYISNQLDEESKGLESYFSFEGNRLVVMRGNMVYENFEITN